MEPNKQKQFILPVSIISLHDVSKLMTELDGVDNFFLQVQTRRPGDSVELPRTTSTMDDLLQQNDLNLLKAENREKLKYILQTVRTKAPILHMSFSAEPDNVFMEKIISWLRLNIHPILILQVGIQPNIGAGFTLRTPNRFFDFSLRQHLVQNSGLLIKALIEDAKL